MRRTLAAIVLAATALAPPAQAQRTGISAERLQMFEDATMPGKEFRLLRTTYAPGGQNAKHYHTSHVVFFVLQGSGVWQEEGQPPVTLRAGDTLHARPGTVHSHRNASATDPLVFLEFVVVEKGQRSTVPLP